ncbi:bifunctional riboflavin kinase/FAD synthetase [Aestuariibius sp. 2305UL40-4]|uniref:bifunctional riboflavin kinase/FAD synthetase n=1 Tax=Aestuariibius violaceus TaxID=3234132 RepID=UPI00345E417C
MRIVRDITKITPEDRGAAAAIGNFDGVHLGHQAVIDLARKAAKAQNAPLGIMTFEPHPRRFFAPDIKPFRLMDARAKAHRLEKLGVDILYEVPFNETLAALTAEQFAGQIIHDALGLSHVVVGADFRFGKGRQGDADTLISFGKTHGFEVSIAEMVGTPVGEVSSTNIRQALSEGRPDDAAAMLGHWHRIEGIVIHGEKRGRDLGYPTANLAMDDLHLPAFGVYATMVDVLTGPHKGSYSGATSIGIRPMFGENTPNCETYILDFKGDLYDAEISVALVEFLRPEEKFDSLDGLIHQMEADCIRAREVLQDA